jgi:mannan endo-1,4-beta-mannosidase
LSPDKNYEYGAVFSPLLKEKTMNRKRIQKIVGLIIALVIILGSTIPTQAAMPAAETAGSSIYWGALINGKAPSTTNLNGIFNSFETRSKKKMSIIHWGQPWIMPDGSWGEFQTDYFDNVRNRGSIPMLNWASQKLGAGINQSDFQLRDIYNGTYDTYIRRWAGDAKSWGHPFFLYFDPEMNGWWLPWAEGKTSGGTIINGNSPGDYVKAWRHVHDIFTSVGASNVTWVWSPNHMSTSSQYPALSTLYPGDAYVDWTGLSVYNKYPTWAGLNPLLTGSEGMTWLRNSYNDVLSLAPNKPMMLSQWASNEAGDGGAKKAAWITDALTKQLPINFPKIKAVVWFNWQENPNETYPIESSQAAIDAWAAGISLPFYISNQFANLNTSPIPPPNPVFSIAGRAGFEGVTLSYTDGTPKTIISQAYGAYSLPVPDNWSGTITPTHPCFTFDPVSRPYSNLNANQTDQNFTAIYNPVSGCLNTDVTIGDALKGSYYVVPKVALTKNYDGTQNGPVKVKSRDNTLLYTSERVISGGSFNEMMGFPTNQLTTEYWFPWYDNVSMMTWVMVSNPTAQAAAVDIYVGTSMKSFSVPAGGSITPRFTGMNTGPVRVISTNGVKIFTSERAMYNGTFNEVMGYPANQFTTEYWFPWYDNVSMATWILVGNPSSSVTAAVDVYVGSARYSYSIPPKGRITPRYSGKNDGPVRVVSTNGRLIFASERALYGDSFNEVMGYPANQFTTDYWFPWYDNASMADWVLVGNASSSAAAAVSIYVGPDRYSYTIPPKSRITPRFSNAQTGPVHVISTNGVKIFTSQRVLYGSSFNEVMGYPANKLSTEYWFPWYDDTSMTTDLVISRP